LSLNPKNKLSQDEMTKLLTEQLKEIPGVELEVEQPIAHLISHMLSGVNAEIGVKIYGDNLTVLRQKAEEIKRLIGQVDGLTAPLVEQQQLVPQLRIEIKKAQLPRYGLTAEQVHRLIESTLRGRVATSMIVDQKSFDVLVRYDEPHRTDLASLERMPIELAAGARIPLSEVATIYRSFGPNTIQREDSRRRIIVRVNTLDRDLTSAVAEIKQQLEKVEMPDGYYYEIGGQFKAQQSASRTILILGSVSLVAIFLVLYITFRSVSHVLQILIAVPVGFVGGTLGLMLTGQTLSIAAAVGFISLGGIAIRNGILLLESFRKYQEKIGLTEEAIIKGSMERLAPVLMTTLTTGFGLLPLVIAGTLPGKEILYPVATVILGGLITSALAEYILRPGLYWFLQNDDVDLNQTTE
jgi:HME family heavy-metal exporter